MRENSYLEQMVRVNDCAVYSLFAKGSPSLGRPGNPLSLSEYLAMFATYSNPPAIKVDIKQHFGQLDKFHEHFEHQQRSQTTLQSFERSRAKLIHNGRAKGWVLAVAEIDPAELRFHYTNNAQWRKHKQEIDKYRSAHPEEVARMTDAEIVATLALEPYHETLVFHSPNPVLAVQSTIFGFRVVRGDGTGDDGYEAHVNAYNIVVIEPNGLAQKQISIPNDADPANYIATVTHIQ